MGIPGAGLGKQWRERIRKDFGFKACRSLRNQRIHAQGRVWMRDTTGVGTRGICGAQVRYRSKALDAVYLADKTDCLTGDDLFIPKQNRRRCALIRTDWCPIS